MKIVERRNYFYLFSLILVIFGGLSVYLFDPALGIDLKGGQVLEVKTKANVPEIIRNLNLKASYFKTKFGYLIKSNEDLTKLWFEILKIDSQSVKLKSERISGTLSSELRNKAILMIGLVLLTIGIYTALAFYRLKNHFSLFKLGLVVIITLFHDVVATIGIYVVLSKFLNFDLDIKFITALLIVAGFSVHDTIVVFDRLRENIIKLNKKTIEVFNKSLSETMRRSIFTSLTAVISILPLSLLIYDLKAFLFSIQIGIIIGTYSSIFLALPLLFDWST